jgi:hypothetical protein
MVVASVRYRTVKSMPLRGMILQSMLASLK